MPISITPGNIQAILIGNGNNSGEIKYIKDNLVEEIKEQSIAYTSGTGSIYKSGIPVGRIKKIKSKFLINFFSDFQQLKYVFAEIEQEQQNNVEIGQNSEAIDSTQPSTEVIKLNILDEELKILNETNERFLNENQKLKSEINDTKNKILKLQKEIEQQNNIISQNTIDQKELNFLRLNLIYSSKCIKTSFGKGYKVGTTQYRDCILNKGKKIND